MNAEKIAFFSLSFSFFSLFLSGQERRQKRIPYIMYRDVGTGRAGALCVQMDFTRTFEANAKCNNINHV